MATEPKKRPYWYFITDSFCPACMRSETERERRYTPRPKRWEKRHKYIEAYDCWGS